MKSLNDRYTNQINNNNRLLSNVLYKINISENIKLMNRILQIIIVGNLCNHVSK